MKLSLNKKTLKQLSNDKKIHLEQTALIGGGRHLAVTGPIVSCVAPAATGPIVSCPIHV